MKVVKPNKYTALLHNLASMNRRVCRRGRVGTNQVSLNRIGPMSCQRNETTNLQLSFASHPSGSLSVDLDAALKRLCQHSDAKICLELVYRRVDDIPKEGSLSIQKNPKIQRTTEPPRPQPSLGVFRFGRRLVNEWLGL